jgi:hypothetical protein
MSESKKVTLSLILNILKKSYKSIDIRAILAKSDEDNSWYCVVLKILLTNQDVNQIKKKHSEMGICHIDSDRFKVAFECRKIDEIDLILNEIKQGRIKVSGTSSKLLGSSFETIREKEVTLWVEETCEYKCKMAFTSMIDSPITALHKLGIAEHEMGINLDEISYCLGMGSLRNPNNIIILLPIYCKRVLSGDDGKYLAVFQIHRSLVSSLKGKVKIFHNGESHIKNIQELDLSTDINVSEEMVMVNIPMTPKLKIKKTDYIEIDIFHKVVPSITITNERFWGSEVLASKKYSFWLKNVIERIDPELLVLKGWLEGKNDNTKPEDFEKAVAMIFSLSGLIVVHVGNEYENATVPARRNKYKKTSISIDIIALLPEPEVKEIFLCQCTTDWNDQKIIDILNISNELRRLKEASQIKIHPIVITQVESKKIINSKNTAESKGVNVIAFEDLAMLLSHINQNKKPHESALSLLK